MTLGISLCITATGCASSTPPSHDAGTNQSTRAATVTVIRGSLAPTLSGDASVHAQAALRLESPAQGRFHAIAQPGQSVTAGETIATIDDEPVIAPVDAIVSAVTDTDAQVPRHYPLFSLDYTGFALDVDTGGFADMLEDGTLITGKYQLANGAPHDCLGVFPLEGTDGTLTCLIPKDRTARTGVSGFVVVTAPAQAQVLLLPVTAVAGRSGTGLVTRIDGDATEQVSVSLGASDGANIVITDGLSEHDVVSATAPNLDTKTMP